MKLWVLLLLALAVPARGAENLAPKAAITATSEYSDDWGPRFVADGLVPDALCANDKGRAWAVDGKTHGAGADLLFIWEREVTIAAVVYYGRTAYDLSDCWNGYQLFFDGEAKPAAAGRVERMHGPQRILLPAPRKARKLLIRFTGSWGGPNPGAAEVQVFSSLPAPADLIPCQPAVVPAPARPLPAPEEIQANAAAGRALDAAEGLKALADANRLTPELLALAAGLLEDRDPFARAVAEWAIAARVGHDNDTDQVVWPAPDPPDWYRKWTALDRARLVEMDWVRQAVSTGIHRDPAALSASLEEMLARGQAVIADMERAGLPAEKRRAAGRHLEALQALRAPMAAAAAKGDLPAQRALWLQGRRELRPVVLASPAVDFGSLVFCTQFAAHHKPNVVGTHQAWTHKPGGDLVVLAGLQPDGKARKLIAGKLGPGHVQGFDLWFDAGRICFAWARQEGWPNPKGCKGTSRWPQGDNNCYNYEMRQAHEPPHLYEIRADVSAGAAPANRTRLKQLTNDPFWSDVEPTYLPDGSVAFTSDRCAHAVVCDSFNNDLTNLNLYSVSPAGEIRRLTNQKDIDRYPRLLDNGLIAYTRWEYQERHFWDVHSIWTVRPDGTLADALFKQHLGRPYSLRDVRSVPGSGSLIATAAGHHCYAYGPLVLVDPGEGMSCAAGIRVLTPGCSPQEGGRLTNAVVAGGGVQDAGGFYQTPYALSDTTFLAAYAYRAPDPLYGNPLGGVDSNGAALYLLDRYGNKELVYRDLLLSCAYPMPLRARPRPPAFPDATNQAALDATCILTDVYDGMKDVPRGTIKYLRISEHVPWPVDAKHGSLKYGWGNMWEPLPGVTDWNPVRVIGTVRVAEDGSACFKVPALDRAAVYFQALDKDLMEVRRMRSSVSFQPGEVRSCSGCHESREKAPVQPAAAPPRVPQTPVPPPWGAARALGYEWLIQPVLDRRCGSCHAGAEPQGKVDLSRRPVMTKEREYFQSYVTLMGRTVLGNGPDAFISCADRFSDGSVTPPMAFGSHRSRLVALLRAGHHGVSLSPQEWETLVTWIDANAPYHDRFINKRPDDGGPPRRDVEVRWP